MFKITIEVDKGNVKVVSDVDYSMLGMHAKGGSTTTGQIDEIIVKMLEYVQTLTEGSGDEQVIYLCKLLGLKPETIKQIATFGKKKVNTEKAQKRD